MTDTKWLPTDFDVKPTVEELADVLKAMIAHMPRPYASVRDLAEGADKEHPLAIQARALLARIRGDAT